MCFTWFLCQFVFNKRFLISRKVLGVSLIWAFFSHVGAIFYETAHRPIRVLLNIDFNDN